MSTPEQNPIPVVKPLGNSEDPRGFYQLLVAHVTWLAVHNFSKTTVEKRALYVRAFALWCIDCDLTSPHVITKPILESFQRYLFSYRKSDGKPLAWSSQHLHLKELRQFFSWLGIRDRAIFEVLYSTGIRRAEVCSLHIDNIHVDRQVLFIGQGKGQRDRYVPIGMRALLWIARYVEQAREQLAIDPKERTLFLTLLGAPINPDSLTEYGRRYIKSANIAKPGACHIFRHTMATLMHDGGADIRTIQAILGHARLDTTQIYTQVSLKKLLDTHRKTHPAEQPDPDTEPPAAQRPKKP